MGKQPIKDKFSEQVFAVLEVETGLFQSVFPTRLAHESDLHGSEDDAWLRVEDVRERDAQDNSQFGVGA